MYYIFNLFISLFQESSLIEITDNISAEDLSAAV